MTTIGRPRAVASAVMAVAVVVALGCGSDQRALSTPSVEMQSGGVRLAKVAGGLGDALYVTSTADQPNRLYVVQQRGRILMLNRGRVAGRPFLDISRQVSTGGEQGLLGLAFHPQYRQNGRFYVNYTDRDGDTRVVEYRRGTSGRADPSSARPLLRIEQPYDNHNGGHLAFGPDGHLYIAVGDGGSGGDPHGNGQRLDTLLGKLLRIDVDTRTGDLPYGIPADNPFRAGAGRDEIYSYGLRNPWRFSFDRRRGDLWIGDVGQGALEEIDYRPKGAGRGANFGWNAFEGRRPFAGRASLRGSVHIPPVAQYGHAKGCSVTGGYVYRGTRAPALRGRYVYADFCTGRVWTMRAGPRPGGIREITARLRSLSSVTSFGEGPGGDLYVVASGSLYRFVSA